MHYYKSVLSSELKGQLDRLAALITAHAEMIIIVAERKLTIAPHQNGPLAEDRVYKLAEEGLVYSERNVRMD